VLKGSVAGLSSRILILVDRLPIPGLRSADRRVLDLISELVSIFPRTSIVLVSVDWCDAPECAAIPAGIEIVSRRSDWSDWARECPAELIFVHGPIAAQRFGTLFDTTWRDVPLIVDSAALVHPERKGLREAHDPAGNTMVAEVWRQADSRLVSRASAFLCASIIDEQIARAIAPGVRSFILPGRFGSKEERTGFDQRRDAIFIGSFAEGLDMPDEDAVRFLADDVMPVVRSHIPDCRLHVVGDDLPPVIRLLDGDSVNVRWIHDDATRWCRGAKVVLAARRFGRVPMLPVLVGAACGTPVVGIGDAAPPEANCHLRDEPGEVARALIPLLTEPAAWQIAHDAITSWTREALDPVAYRSTLIEAVVAADFVTTPERNAEIPKPVPFCGRTRGRWVAIRDRRGLGLQVPDELQTDGMPSPRVPNANCDEGWYDAWYRHRAPGVVDRAEMRCLAASLRRRPSFSIITPVFNADPDILRAAVDSVRAQVYGRWELCLVDDRSTRTDTFRALLELAQSDSRISLERQPVNVGIARASNAGLDRATGDFIGFLDHDDLLTCDALLEVAKLLDDYPELDIIYSDEHKLGPNDQFYDPALKPAFSPDLLRSINYFAHLTIYRRELLEQLGGFREGFDGAQDLDLALRAVENTSRVGHVAKPLYSWRAITGSTAAEHSAKPDASEAGRRALSDALARRNRSGSVSIAETGAGYRTRYDVVGRPKVAIIIPTRDRVDLLRSCIDSIRERSSYDRYEVTIVDNQSREPSTIEYLASFDGPVIRYPYRFHFARMMNLAALSVDADQIVFLNNDVEINSGGWLEAMLEHAQRSEVGAVGARLLYGDRRVQHEGIFVGLGRYTAGNVDFSGSPRSRGEWHFMSTTGGLVRNFAAVTGACLMIRPPVFWEVGGFAEQLHVAFNDVDLGLRLRHRGYELVYTPHATLTHYESVSRGDMHPTENDIFFRERWGVTLTYTDPYNNPNYDVGNWFHMRK
jgi:O-antigen biosynthesis protein